MTIQVLPDDIANGVAKACSSCPVALAISRSLGLPFDSVSVTADVVKIWPKNGLAYYLLLPPHVQLAIQVFDKTEAMEPFSFDLEIPT